MLLFVHGGEKVKQDSTGKYYTDGSFSHKNWEKYKKTFKNMRVIFRKDTSKYDDEYLIKNFNIVDEDINVSTVTNIRASIISYLSIKQRYQLKKHIRCIVRDSDYIILRVPSDESNIVARACKKAKKPYMVEVVACAWDTLWNHGILGKVLAPISYIKTKKTIKNASVAQYVTKSFLQKRYPTRGISIGCSDVVINTENESILKSRIRRIDYVKTTKKIILGTIGNFDVKYKDQKTVIKALSKLKKYDYNFEYRMIGAGDQHILQAIAKKAGVEKNIKFYDPVPHDKIMNWLKEIDIYIHPSLVEGLCRSIIEAKSVACPCIVSNAGGNIELISRQYVFKKGNVNDLVEKIKYILHNNNMKEQAQANYNDSSKYNNTKLNSINTKMYKEYKNRVVNQTNKRKNTMKTITAKEQKRIMLDMLRYFDTICRKNNINYSLIGGSLIGAIRHKGFIPWDDDIDIALTKDNYTKLKTILDKEDGIYQTLKPGKGGDRFLFTKLIDKRTQLIENRQHKFDSDYGIFLDIFCYNNAPADIIDRKKHFKKLKILRRLNIRLKPDFKNESITKNIFCIIINILSTVIGYKKIHKKYNKLLSQYDHLDTGFVVSNWPTYDFKKEIQLKSDMDKYIDVDFEGIKAMAFKNYDNILRTTFGNYMELPPKEKRIPKHNLTAYWKDEVNK